MRKYRSRLWSGWARAPQSGRRAAVIVDKHAQIRAVRSWIGKLAEPRRCGSSPKEE